MPAPDNPNSGIQRINHPPGSASMGGAYGLPLPAIPDQVIHLQWQTYQKIFAACEDAVLLACYGQIIYANQVAIDLLAATNNGQILGKSLQEVLQLNSDVNTLDYIHQHANLHVGMENVLFPMHHQLHGESGQRITVEIHTTSFTTGEDEGVMVILHNIVNEPHATAPSLQEHYLQQVANDVPALIAYIDSDERYQFVNAAYEIWFGMSREEIVGRKIGQILPLSYDVMQPHIANVLQGNQVSYEDKLHIGIRGERALTIIMSPDTAADGIVRGFSMIAIDVTPRRNHASSFQANERRVRPYSESLSTMIAQCDKNYHVRMLNQALTKRFGFSFETAIGKPLADLIGQTTFSQLQSYCDASLKGTVQEHELKLAMQQAGEHCMHVIHAPVYDSNGNVHGFFTVLNDTTQLRRAEDLLRRHELEFKTLVENSPDIIARIDRNMRHLYVNPAVEHAFGFSSASYMGKTKRELGFPSDMVQAWEAAATAAFNTNTEQHLDHELDKNGKIYYFSTRLIPEHASSGPVNSLLEITYDVTERTRIERERDELLLSERTARIQAETSARARDEFLAIVSHELRAPLNGIQSWAHVLENYVKDTTSAPLAQRALLGIKTGVAQQVRLIEDLLDVTRMMSGKLRLVKQPIALLPVIQAAVESVRDIAAAKRQSIASTYTITTEQIEGDADRIQQIIWNLLSNAVKFTPEKGSIWISASHTEEEACIVVRDNGIGISAEFLPHLFDRFSQEDTSSTRGHSGLGLGLFLVHYLIGLHGGRIEVQSEGEGKGAAFSVYIPLRTPMDKYVPATASADIGDTDLPLPSLEDLTILLIDDQEEVRESLSVVLSSAGAEVYAAASTKEAMAWLSTLAKEDLPDLLICDIAMPGEDGYSALRKIRAWQTTDGHSPLNRLPAIALTAFSQREDRIRAFTAGFNMHVTKPAVAEELIIVVASLAAKK